MSENTKPDGVATNDECICQRMAFAQAAIKYQCPVHGWKCAAGPVFSNHSVDQRYLWDK